MARCLQKSRNCERYQGHQKGISLVELMVFMAIGVFISLVATRFLVASSRAFVAQNIDGRIQENAMYALNAISKNIRLAGFSGDAPISVDLLANHSICPDSDGDDNESVCVADQADFNGSDRIAIELVTRPTGIGLSNTGGNACDGTSLSSTGYIHFVNSFWIGTEGELMCQSIRLDNGAALTQAIALIEGIDLMQVQYGIDTNSDGVADTYTSVSNFAALATATASFANEEDVADAVKSVRIALLMGSGIKIAGKDSAETQASRSYILLDGPALVFDDRKKREIYSTTVMLPNGN